MDYVKTISPTPPGSFRSLFFGFAPILPPSAVITAPVISISAGFTVSGAAEIGTYVPATRAWTAGAAGLWVRQAFLAGVVLGARYRIDCIVTVNGGPATEALSLYAPVGYTS